MISLGFIALVNLSKISREGLRVKNKLSAYEGLKLNGRVEETYVRGQLVFSEGVVLGPRGKLL